MAGIAVEVGLAGLTFAAGGPWRGADTEAVLALLAFFAAGDVTSATMLVAEAWVDTADPTLFWAAEEVAGTWLIAAVADATAAGLERPAGGVAGAAVVVTAVGVRGAEALTAGGPWGDALTGAIEALGAFWAASSTGTAMADVAREIDTGRRVADDAAGEGAGDIAAHALAVGARGVARAALIAFSAVKVVVEDGGRARCALGASVVAFLTATFSFGAEWEVSRAGRATVAAVGGVRGDIDAGLGAVDFTAGGAKKADATLIAA